VWDPKYELTVTVDLARPGGMARRPYVAVWIEDKDHFPVRTIALLFNKYRYLPELRAWTRADRQRTLAGGGEITGTVSSATRPPGRYTFTWDGKDQRGKPVTPGPYTVWVEAAREHGSYEVLHEQMDFSAAPKQSQIPGTAELTSVALDYHKAGAAR
jgi:FAD:protein FMN transferase